MIDKLTRIPFVKVEDLVIIDEVVFGELVRVYLEHYPELRGQVSEDKDFEQNFIQTIGLLMAEPQGSA